MKVFQRFILFYFSGTGNAKKIASWFYSFAVEQGVEVQSFDLSQIDITTFEPIKQGTLIGIIAPIHGFNYSPITLNFIRNFPSGNNKVLLMCTRGGLKLGRYVTPGLSGVAFMVASLIFRKKGYELIGFIPYDMPSNWLSVHPALKKKTVDFINKRNHDRVKVHTERIFKGKKLFLAYRDLLQDILIAPISLAYYIVGRFFLAKSFYATSACNSCGLCSSECPTKAIETRDGRPFWTYKCESCMKCFNNCPKRAIQTTHGLWIILFFTCSLITGLIYKYLLSEFSSTLLKTILFTLFFFLLLHSLYALHHYFLRNKVFEKVINYTSLTYYKFWGRFKNKS